MKVLLSTLNAKYIHSSLALRYLASYCQPSGWNIDIREYTVNNGLLEILSDIYARQADVIGLACYIWNIDASLELAALIKKVHPHAVIVLGGPEVSYQAEDILTAHAAIDYIILGEGEKTLAALLTALNSGQPAGHIAGLAYRACGHIVAGQPQVVTELADIPFPYTKANMAQLKDKIIYYESSRGCPFSCQYCLSSATTGVRFLSQDRVLRDLQFFAEHDVKQVKFVDRTFNARKEHYFPIIKFLADQTCRTNFHFEIAADIWDAEVVEFLRHAPPGRFQFEIGIQSTNKQTLAAIQRHNNWPKIVEYVGKVRRHGNIHLHLDLIVGLPHEDMESFAQSFDAVYSLKPDMLQIGFLKLLRGSDIRRRSADYGYVYMNQAPYEVLANNYLSYGQIRQLKIVEEVFEQVYNSGRFAYSLPWFIALAGGKPFNFYYQLASYWEQQGHHLVAHSSKSIYKHMAAFCAANYPANMPEYQEILKFDALMGEHGAVRPDFLPWNQINQASTDRWAEHKTLFWRDSQRVRKYLPEFSFSTWRDIKKTFHIEVFSLDIPTLARGGTDLEKREVAVLFSYQQTKPSYQVIAHDDFWV